METNIVAMVKWRASNVAVKVVDETLQLHGGYGYIYSDSIERFYRTAKVPEIYEGIKKLEIHH